MNHLLLIFLWIAFLPFVALDTSPPLLSSGGYINLNYLTAGDSYFYGATIHSKFVFLFIYLLCQALFPARSFHLVSSPSSYSWSLISRTLCGGGLRKIVSGSKRLSIVTPSPQPAARRQWRPVAYRTGLRDLETEGRRPTNPNSQTSLQQSSIFFQSCFIYRPSFSAAVI